MMTWWLLLWVLAGSLTDGSDPIRRYTPADYKAAFQNWGIVQDADGRLFSANTAGVLMFDGTRWELYPLPENRIVRSIAVDSTGRVWVGSENLIGYMEPDAQNGFRFVTALDSVAGDVWTIRSTTQATWFQANDELIAWSNGRFARIPLRSGAQKAMWNIDGRILVHEFGVGWFYMSESGKSPVSELTPFNSIRVVSFIPEPGGSWIIVTRSNGLYRMEADYVTLRKMDLPVPETSSARRLNDGSIVLGTVRNGLQVLTPDLTGISQPGQEIGLHLDAIWAVMQDDEGHVWMGTDRGLVQMYRYPDFDLWDARSGLVGNIQAIRRFGNRLVVGTSVGMFIQTDTGFDPIEDVDQAVWDLLVRGNELWIATAEGLRVWNGSTLRRVGDKVPTYSLLEDVRGDGSIWVGRAGGLSRLTASGRWTQVSGVVLDVRNMAQRPDGTLWAGTFRGGVVRVAPDLSVSNYLESVSETRVAFHAGDLLAGTADGIRRWDEASSMFIPWESSSVSGVYRMVAEVPNSLWVVRYRNSESWLESITGDRVIRDPYRRLPNRGLFRLFVEPDAVWVGTSSGLYRIDRSMPAYRPGPLRMATHSVAVGPSTRIRFAAPWFEDPESVSYRFRLEGDTDWTEWDVDAEALFLGLWEGLYRFEAEAMNKYGATARLGPIEFRIAPPWYRTPFAYAGMVLVFGLGVWGIVHATQRISRLRTMRLEKLVRDRTRQVQRQKDELIRSNKALTDLIDQKNTLLGIAAHDLKNPLASIQGFAELLSFAMDEEEDLNRIRNDMTEQLGYILGASTDMSHIIKDLLELAVTQKGDLVMKPTVFPFTDMVYTITTSYRAVAEKKDIRLVADLPSESMVAFADSNRLQEVVLNLVSNAVKYTRIGGTVSVSMARETRDGKDWVGVVIRDEGPGFTEKDKESMFGLFTKLSARPTGDERSNGIGLYIVKEFTEKNSGRLHLDTEVGVGSAFTVWIPASQG